jgi:hypothetical protein
MTGEIDEVQYFQMLYFPGALHVHVTKKFIFTSKCEM